MLPTSSLKHPGRPSKVKNIAQPLVFYFLSLVSGACTAQAGCEVRTAADQPLAGISGSWQDEADPHYFIGLEGSFWTLAPRGQVQSVSRILSLEDSRITLCQGGWRRIWEVRLDATGSLIVKDPKTSETHKLRGLASKPPALNATPLPLPGPMPLPPAKVAEIQRQVSDRVSRARGKQEGTAPESQAFPLRPDHQQAPPAPFSISDLEQIGQWAQTVAYLKTVITEVGWIDVERFGYAASNAAFYIAHHSSDLPLMMTALPGVEKDALAGRTEGEDYALLFDRVQLGLGRKQRYGTQVGFDAANRAFVLSIEEPGRVDQLRESLDMMPLGAYVQAVAWFNGAFAPSEIHFSEDCADR